MAENNSRVDVFKEHIQKIVSQTIGAKVSKNDAWNLFKNLQLGTVEFALNEESGVLTLSGVGKYEARLAAPRMTTLSEGKRSETDVVPRVKFRPSSKLKNYVADYNNPEVGKLPHFGIFVKENSESVEEI